MKPFTPLIRMVRSALVPAARRGGAAGSANVVPSTQVMDAQRLPSAALSFVIMDADTGRVVVSHNPDTPRSPASTIKTVTTFAALDMLGPAFVWQTHAWMRDGDLYLQGGGDPYMTLERWWSFVQGLRSQGLSSIPRDIVIDDGVFSLPKEYPGAFDGRPNRAYNVVPDALMVNFQSIEFTLAADTETHRVDIDRESRSGQPRDRQSHTLCGRPLRRCGGESGFSGCLAHLGPGGFFRGLVRALRAALLRARSAAAGHLRLRHLRQNVAGIGRRVRRQVAHRNNPMDAKPIYTFDSLSLAEIVRLTNKYSNNLMARHLLLTLGKERYGDPATLEKGVSAITEWSRERGFDLSGVDIDNGSGLSRSTRISVLQMAKILSAAYHSPFAPEYLASFPLAGMDGTLRSRMKNSPAGAIRLKTGHLDGVSGVAGYVTAKTGKTFVLVSLVNNVRADFGAAEPVHAALATWILDHLE